MVMFEQFCLRGDARTSLENAYANEKTRHVSDLTGMCFKMEADLNTGAAFFFTVQLFLISRPFISGRSRR